MTAGLVNSGMGVTIAFGTSAFLANITGISGGDLVREMYDSSHFGSAVGTDFADVRWMEQAPAEMASVDDIAVEIQFDIDTLPPIDQPIEVITIQCPPKTGQATGGKLVVNGCMKKYGGSYTMKDIRRGSFIIGVSGPPEFTAGAV